MVDLNSTISMVSLNVYGINPPLKRQRLSIKLNVILRPENLDECGPDNYHVGATAAHWLLKYWNTPVPVAN